MNSPLGGKGEESSHDLPPTESEYDQELILQSTSAEGANLGEPLYNPEESHRWLWRQSFHYARNTNYIPYMLWNWTYHQQRMAHLLMEPNPLSPTKRQSINTVVCGVYSISLQTNTVSIPAISYLPCQDSRPTGLGYSCFNNSLEWQMLFYSNTTTTKIQVLFKCTSSVE